MQRRTTVIRNGRPVTVVIDRGPGRAVPRRSPLRPNLSGRTPIRRPETDWSNR